MPFRINIISTHRNQTGLSQDADLIHGVFANAFKKDLKVRRVPHYQPICPEAELNVFLEVITPIHFNYAAKNIWIPNPEWTQKSWKPYMEMVDEIWVKTREAEEIFKSLTSKPVKYIGWTSLPKGYEETKNYDRAFVCVGKNIFRHPQMLIDAYCSAIDKSTFPELYIPYNGTVLHVDVPEADKDRIHLYPTVLKDAEYNEILDECGLAICLSGAEGFGHAVNEAMSSGCNLILGDIKPFHELVDHEHTIWVESEKSVEHPECYATINVWNDETIQKAFRQYVAQGLEQRKVISEMNFNIYKERHKNWVETTTALVKEQFTDFPIFVIADLIPKEDDLPYVSIVTPTRDRIPFMELAKACFESFAYPREKLEWIVVDNGDISCKHVVQDMENVKYIYEPPGQSISRIRNIGVRNASHDVIIFMDDDDIYPNNSIITRVSALLRKPEVSCVFCTTIPCYDIVNFISFINVPPNKLPMSQRVSEASMAFTRKFWEDHPFDDNVHIAEGNTFIHSREHMCRELCPEEILVSLVHPKTTSSRRAPSGMEANGCHFGFSDDLFKAVTLIGELMKV